MNSQNATFVSNRPEVLIVSSARSGSNLLTSMIAASNMCLPFGEILKPAPSDAEIQYAIDVELSRIPSNNKAFADSMRNCLRRPARDRLNFFRADIDASYSGSMPAISYKLFAEHLYYEFNLVDDCALAIKVAEPTEVAIILYRNNLRLKYLSMIRAALSNNWIGGKADVFQVPNISVSDYLDWRDWIVRTWALALDHFSSRLFHYNKVLTIAYESIQALEDQRQMSNRLSWFIFDRPISTEWAERLPFEVPSRQSEPNGSKSPRPEELVSHLPSDRLADLLLEVNPKLQPLLTCY